MTNSRQSLPARRHTLALLFLAVSVAAVPAGAGPKKGKEGASGETREKEVATTGTPSLWSDRGDVSGLDLYWGVGSESGMPAPPFRFVKEDTSGTNPKIKVLDAKGVKWNMKFDEEVHAEVAASRIAWACGYWVEESYFVRGGKVEGVTGLGRAAKFVGKDGTFASAMFEKRPDNVTRRAINWAWESNPFNGTKELSGLAILNAMLNNWDAKDTNNNVLGLVGPDGSRVEAYLVADWGGTFGKMGGFTSHSKWDMADYLKQAFLDGVSSGRLKLHYSGKMSAALESVPLEHARWFSGIVSALREEQVRDAFRAAGATPEETQGFSRRFVEKAAELRRAVGN